MKKIRAAGGITALIFTADQAIDLIDRIDARQEARRRNQIPP
jgi:hypothetical protein